MCYLILFIMNCKFLLSGLTNKSIGMTLNFLEWKYTVSFFFYPNKPLSRHKGKELLLNTTVYLVKTKHLYYHDWAIVPRSMEKVSSTVDLFLEQNDSKGKALWLAARCGAHLCEDILIFLLFYNICLRLLYRLCNAYLHSSWLLKVRWRSGEFYTWLDLRKLVYVSGCYWNMGF